MLLSRHSIPRHGLGCGQQAAAGSNTRALHAAALRRQGGRHHETAARVAQIDKLDIQVPEIGGDSEDAAYCGSEGTYLSIHCCNGLFCSSRRFLNAQHRFTSLILSSRMHALDLSPAPCQYLLWQPFLVVALSTDLQACSSTCRLRPCQGGASRHPQERQALPHPHIRLPDEPSRL